LPELAGVARRRRSRSPEGSTGERERASEGWAGSVWPTQTRAGRFSRTEWASRPVGPSRLWKSLLNQKFQT
jgi:hypothetical protein